MVWTLTFPGFVPRFVPIHWTMVDIAPEGRADGEGGPAPFPCLPQGGTQSLLPHPAPGLL